MLRKTSISSGPRSGEQPSNDPIGYLPLYYARTSDGGLLGSTSLVILGRTARLSVDALGVAQRLTGPHYSNFGRRTLLKGVWRILPGERAMWRPGDPNPLRNFDNSLCNGILDGDIASIARRVFDCLRDEVVLATGHDTPIYLALSGGWDSRYILGAVSHAENSIECLTYGERSHYETSIAARCAKAVSARHHVFPLAGTLFPPRDRLARQILETGHASYLTWLPILDGMSEQGLPTGNIPILLGDQLDSLDGRNIVSASSRAARLRDSLNRLKGRPSAIPAVGHFDHWADRVTSKTARAVLKSSVLLSDDLKMQLDLDSSEALVDDIRLSCSRVSANIPAFSAMYDELFFWFHKGRYLTSSQLLMMSSFLQPLCPPMSLRFLRLVSTIHPRLRIGRCLLDAIARLPEFRELSKIPSATIPWIGAKWPRPIREGVWFLRYKCDEILSLSAKRKRDPGQRQRLLRSMDYLQEYRRPETEEHVRAWFSGMWLRPDSHLDAVRARAEMKQRPFFNLDISVCAQISITLDLCQGERFE